MLNPQFAEATMNIANNFARKKYARTRQAEDIAMTGLEYIIRYHKNNDMPSTWYICRNVIKAAQNAGYKKKVKPVNDEYTAIPSTCSCSIPPVEAIEDALNPDTTEYLTHYLNPLESLLEGEEIRMLRSSPIISAQLKLVIDGMLDGQKFKQVCQTLGKSAPRVRHNIHAETASYFAKVATNAANVKKSINPVYS